MDSAALPEVVCSNVGLSYDDRGLWTHRSVRPACTALRHEVFQSAVAMIRELRTSSALAASRARAPRWSTGSRRGVRSSPWALDAGVTTRDEPTGGMSFAPFARIGCRPTNSLLTRSSRARPSATSWPHLGECGSVGVARGMDSCCGRPVCRSASARSTTQRRRASRKLRRTSRSSRSTAGRITPPSSRCTVRETAEPTALSIATSSTGS